uniref:RB_A domain-containing protein n=1 Tax=Macrostomum lignano TaxID=282301 RepID=A0A1I8FH98_9PLAT
GVARLQALLLPAAGESLERPLCSKMRQYCSGKAPWDDIRAQSEPAAQQLSVGLRFTVTEADVNRNEMQRRANLTETLFYMTLDAILTCEADKVPDEDQLGVRLSSLLGNRTLLACLFRCLLPAWCLEASGTHAFHLFKIVESLIEAVNFPRDIVRHLRLCVDRVVDSLAWTAGSPLWKLVAAESRPRLLAVECQRPLVAASATSPKMGKGLSALQAFYRHLHRLCDTRLAQLSSELHLLNPVSKQRAAVIINRVLRDNPGLLRQSPSRSRDRLRPIRRG